ncbi:TetR/AcrR family transcriptional regulator, partial [Actinocatenispora thailandica]
DASAGTRAAQPGTAPTGAATHPGTPAVPGRRERQRAATRAEILRRARDQLAERGVPGLSLNGIGRAMGMSGPAVYRYFDSRAALVTALATVGYQQLTAAVTAAAEAARRRRPAGQVRAVATAYREWALADPAVYRVMLTDPDGDGHLAAPTVVTASHQAMRVLLELVAALPGPLPPAPPRLRGEVADWARSRDSAVDPTVAATAVRLWVRLHGIVSMELDGLLAAVGIDAGTLLDTELDQFLGGS